MNDNRWQSISRSKFRKHFQNLLDDSIHYGESYSKLNDEKHQALETKLEEIIEALDDAMRMKNQFVQEDWQFVDQIMKNLEGYLHARGLGSERAEISEVWLEFAKTTNHAQERLSALKALGEAKGQSGDLDAADQFLQESLQLARDLELRLEEGQILGDLGMVAYLAGDIPQALTYNEQCLAIYQEIDYQQGIAMVLGQFGMIFKKLGNFAKSLDYYQQSLSVAEKNNVPYIKADILGNMGNLYSQQGDLQKALFYYQEVIHTDVTNKRRVGTTYYNISNIFYKQGYRIKAVEFAKKALEVFRELNDPVAQQIERELNKWKA